MSKRATDYTNDAQQRILNVLLTLFGDAVNGYPPSKLAETLRVDPSKITRDLDFSLDDSTGRMVVKVTDRASGDVVRQIPSEEALRLAENLEQVRSLLFKAEA